MSTQPTPPPNWDLTELYTAAEDPALEAALSASRERAEAFATAYRGTIAGLDADALVAAFREYESVLEAAQRPGFYASLLLASDTQDAAAQRLDDRTRDASSEIGNLLVFFDLELQAIDDERIEVLRAEPALAPWRYVLESTRRHKPHTLSEPEEKILARKYLSGRAASVGLFDELCGSLRFEVEIDGEMQQLADGEVMALLRQPDRDLRRRAQESFLGEHERHALVHASVFNAVLLDHRVDGELRNYPTAIAPRHEANDIEAEAVDAMMDAVDAGAPTIRRYFALKAKRLGLEKLAVSDLYAPFSDVESKIPFEDAKEMVLGAFGAFSGEFADGARQFFDGGWIDAAPRPGKAGGAFCAALSPGHHPYVLQSFTGTMGDVSTLAHELGHGVHDLLAQGQSHLSYHPPLVLAETASIFSEMLLIDSRLKATSDREERIRISADRLDEIYGTVFRQNAMTRFELAAHAARKEQKLSAAELDEIWMSTQRDLFGDAVEIPEIYRVGWSYIPHFLHAPFYCYAYTFGELLVLALYARYLDEGESFVPKLLDLLRLGGSEKPARALASIGIDLADPEFWAGGIRTTGRWIDELEAALQGDG